jgi:hypothetical protein
MKKLLLILLISISCSEKDIPEEIPVLDCDCDRIAEVKKIGIFNDKKGVDVYRGVFTTINECSKIQREYSFSNITDISLIPKVGECK